MRFRKSSLLAVLVLALAACSSNEPPPVDDLEAAGDVDDHHALAGDAGAEDEPLPDLEPDYGEQEPDIGTDAGAVRDGGAAARDAGADSGGGTKAGGGGSPGSSTPAPGCKILAVSAAPYLKYGLHPGASNALAYLKVTAGRIVQTIGNLPASAGTHGQDGVAGGRPYSAATDLSVAGMTDTQVSTFLDKLTSVGFVAYYRKPGYDGWPSTEARHLHIIWVGAPMKLSLRNQVRDWRVGKNGLASHTTYTFKTWSQCWRQAIWARYLTANPATG